MGLGSAAIVQEGELPEAENPNDKNLGAEYFLVWGDTL
jgi:hypothetical protein